MKKHAIPITIRHRAILIGLLLIYLNCYWTIFLEAIWYAWPTDAVPFSTVIVFMFVLGLLNFCASKYAPALALNYGELITIYIMTSLSSAIANWNMLAGAVPIAGHAYWFAAPENEWKSLIWRYLPDWLTISDKAVLGDYYQGESTFFTGAHIRGWMKPILAWSAFASAFFGSMIFICVLLRKQWTERERLTFPVIQMPLEMMNTKSRFFQSRLMWIGFAISGGIVLVNSIQFFFPSLPLIPVKRRHIDYLFSQKPWNAVNPMKISFYPFMIGLGFLMPLDLCFSAWFFYLMTKVQLVIISATGVRTSGRFPYFTEQSFGAVVAVCGFYIWMGRGHFKRVVMSLFQRHIEADDADEPISYRAAVIGLMACILFLVLFCVKMGMSLWVAMSYLGLLYMLSIVITRVRAELGMPVHDFEGLEPRTSLLTIAGTRRLGPRNLTSIALLTWVETGDYNPHPMPHQLEGFKMIDHAHANRRQFMVAMFIAVIASSILCFVAALQMYYKYGAASGHIGGIMTRWYGHAPYTRLQRQITLPTSTDGMGVSFMGIGAVVASLLMVLRMQFIWWPFHALGYILASSWAMYNLWTCVLVSWLAKWIILKQGGLKAYRSAMPFFWGLILGDFIVGGMWLAIGLLFDMRVYVFYL